ncbi:MAG: TetR/AcrR family transcriptional regulator [Spirochaetia bacterium]|nr:TetR/AcrR family transcriptional regulator [Spirochaetia bacterium]
MNSREHILSSALNLYNKNGYEAVSLRSVAEQTGISHGHLRHYFPGREFLASSILNDFLAEHDQIPLQTDQKNILQSIQERLQFQYHLIWKYRFLFIDLVHLSRKNPKFKKHFQEEYTKRFSRMKDIFFKMEKEGILAFGGKSRPAEILFSQMFLISTYWVSEAAVLGMRREAAVRHYSRICLDLFLPYLSEKGRELYLALK